MVRSMIAGDTNYSSQTLQEMSEDLKEWVESLEDTCNRLTKLSEELHASGYWENVDSGFQDLILHCTAVYARAGKEIQDVLSEIGNEVQTNHVSRINTLGKTGNELNHNLGQAWHRDYPRKEYGNPEFRKVERLYCVARDMAAGMLDLMNLASRLEDFVGKKTKATNSNVGLNEVVDLKPNFFGLGVNINALIKKFRRK